LATFISSPDPSAVVFSFGFPPSHWDGGSVFPFSNAPFVGREPVDEVLQIPPSLLTCGGCQQNIGDRYFLKAIDQYWHEDCLSCDLCGCRLGEVGRRLYYKLGRKLCRRDYLRYAASQPASHRIMESCELEGTLNAIWSTSPAMNRDAYARSGAHSPIQPDLGCLQGCGIHCLSGQLIPLTSPSFYHFSFVYQFEVQLVNKESCIIHFG